MEIKYHFEVLVLEEVRIFLDQINERSRNTILLNIWKSRIQDNPDKLNKLHEDIWVFKTKYNRRYYQLFAFWDLSDSGIRTLVPTHGSVKDTLGIPRIEIARTNSAKKLYLEAKYHKKTLPLEELTEKYIGKDHSAKRQNFNIKLRRFSSRAIPLEK